MSSDRPRSSFLLGPAIALLVGACGGPDAQPLLRGRISGEYKGMSFTPAFGIAFDRTVVSKLIVLGDEEIDCETPLDDDPPSGNVAIIGLDSFEVGPHRRLLINLMHNVGGLEGRGSNLAEVTITESTPHSVSATVTYAHVDDENFSYGLNGTFMITRCPQ